MYKVIVMGNVSANGLAILREFAEPILLGEPVSRERLEEEIPNADAILHKIGDLDRAVLRRQQRLKIIARHGVGLDYLDLNYIGELGLPVTICPGKNSNAVAELTVALALALMRNILPANKGVKERHDWHREAYMGRELRSIEVGVVGLGRIGRRVAHLMSSFGAGICAYDPFADSDTTQMVSFEELLKRSDLITFHCPLTQDTRQMLNRRSIRLLKEGAFLVNTARGAVIETDALIEAIEEGRLIGAALDVYDTEPPDFQNRLFQLEQVITVPHIASMTWGTQTAMAEAAALEIRRVLVEKQEPLHPI